MSKGVSILFLLIPAMLVSCHSHTSVKQKQEQDLSGLWSNRQKEHFSTGKVQKVFVAVDSSQSYALYLPERYSDSLSWPVIYFFDPQAAGNLPLRKYALWADQFGYVLFGSNNIKNQMSGTDMNRFIRSFFDDTYRRFSLDAKRTYVAGFSGGARVASSIALSDPAIRGVIACGGGFPSTTQLPPVHFDFLAYAGYEDFNLPELIQLDKTLQSQPCRHFLIRFNGKHAWPDSLIFRDAFYWLDFNAMKDKSIPVNDSLIRSFKNEMLVKLKKTSAISVSKRASLLSEMVTFLQGLVPTEKYEKELNAIYTSPAWQKEQEQFVSLIKEENRLQQFYIRAFTTQPLLWWREEVQKLNNSIAKSKGDVKYSKLRLLHFLSLAAYMQADAAIRQKRNSDAGKYVSIYKLVDPANSYVWYFSAILQVRAGQKEQALKMLEKAVKMGFDDLQDMKERPEFGVFKDDPAYQKMLSRIVK